MSLFEAAQNVTVNDGTFHVIGRDQVIVDQSVHTHVYHHGPTSSNQTNQPIEAIVPNPSPLFQGRRAEINKLKEYFAPRVVGKSPTRRSLLLYGMGGIGKTQLCRRFAEETKERFSYIFWIDASTPETLALSLKKIPGWKSAGSDGSAEAILQWISCLEQDWLLILDNAEQHIHNFIPPGQNGNILISSRDRMVGRSTSFESIEVEHMEEEDAVALLLKASCLDPPTTSDAMQSTARAIVRELHCLPLAIDQAGHSIGSGLCGIENFLRLYSSCRKELLDDVAFRNASPYAQTVYSTWELSYQRIKSVSQALGSSSLTFSPEAAQTAIAILQTFAYMHHDNIMKEIFRRAWANLAEEEGDEETQVLEHFPVNKLLLKEKNGEWDEIHFNNGIRVLLSFSLIKQSRSNDSYSIHPLVHSWSRDRLLSSEQQSQWTGTMKLLSSSISWTYNMEDYQFRRHLIPHITANAQLYIGTTSSAKEAYNVDECLRFGLSLDENGNWGKGAELFSQGLALNRRQHGDEHPDTLTFMANLASTFRNQGRWSEAEELEVQVLDIRKKVLGDEHPRTLTSMANLASTFRNQGRWSEAEELDVQVLGIRKKVLGDEHPRTLTSMANLASTFQDQGRWSEAEELQVQVLGICKKVLGDEHPDTLSSMANLAATFQNQGRWSEAEELEVQVLGICKKVLGDEHPHTLSSMANLASTFRNQGRWSEAEELEVQVLGICKKVLGDEHPHTLSSMANLASTFRNQGRWSEAEELEVQVLGICKKVLGDEHPNTLSSMANLASTFRNQGRWSEAEELQVQVLGIRKKVLGDEHPDILSSMANLASTFCKQGRWSEAEELQVQVLGIRKKVLGDEHPDTLSSMANLASTFRNQGRWSEAEELEVQVLGIRKKVLGDEHPDTLSSMANLASTFRNQGRWSEAEELEVQVPGIRKKVLGDEHPDTLSSMANLAATFWNQGRWSEAEELEVQVLTIRKKVLGDKHPDTIDTIHNLGRTCQSQEKWEEAEQMITQAVSLSKQVLGKEHPHTQQRAQNLAVLIKAREAAAQSAMNTSQGPSKVKRALKNLQQKAFFWAH